MYENLKSRTLAEKFYIILIICLVLVWVILFMLSDRVQGYCNYSPAWCSQERGGNWTCVKNGTNAVGDVVCVRSKKTI